LFFCYGSNSTSSKGNLFPCRAMKCRRQRRSPAARSPRGWCRHRRRRQWPSRPTSPPNVSGVLQVRGRPLGPGFRCRG
jgi:hypothetical protein